MAATAPGAAFTCCKGSAETASFAERREEEAEEKYLYFLSRNREEADRGLK